MIAQWVRSRSGLLHQLIVGRNIAIEFELVENKRERERERERGRETRRSRNHHLSFPALFFVFVFFIVIFFYQFYFF